MSLKSSTREVGNTCRNLVGKTDVTRPPDKPSYSGEGIVLKTYNKQGVPGGKANILGGHSIGHSKQKCLFEHDLQT